MLVALEGGGCHLGALARHPAADDLVERYLTDFGHSPAGLAGAAVVVRLQLDQLRVEQLPGATLVALHRQSGADPFLVQLAGAVGNAEHKVELTVLLLERAGDG